LLLIALKLTNEGDMAIKKNYQDDKTVCKVTFTIPGEIAKKYKKAFLVGDFNNWDIDSTPMKKMKRNGNFSVTLELNVNKEYEFRYLLDNSFWINEPDADKLVPTYFQDAENSVIIV
jgi:1,4-alpha-glucan branching enzyme